MLSPAKSSKGVIRKRVLIQASPDIVYEALTNAKDLAQWFCDRAVSDPQVGGELRAYWHYGNRTQDGLAVFTRAVPPFHLELAWMNDGLADAGKQASHTLSYTVRSGKHSTELIVHDRGYPPPDDETYALLDEGWISVLVDLKAHCESKERAAKRLHKKIVHRVEGDHVS